MKTPEVISNSEVPIIIENGVYTASDFEVIVGKRGLDALRAAGLRAVADRYLGREVLDKFRAAHKNRSCNRCASGEAKKGEVKPDDEQNNSEEVETHIQGEIQRNERVAKHNGPRSLRGQTTRLKAAREYQEASEGAA